MAKKRASKSAKNPLQLLDIDTFVGGKDVPAFYANAVRTVVSAYDFTLIIGQVGYKANGEPEMREAARLNLSPQHAKSLAIILAARISDYEERFGTISIEPIADAVVIKARSNAPEQPS